ncbi:uncharacterized protein LOC114938560 [Nylanderia fulva]|uniref:uncharacterized protein LOC114938560 n=1 Tax=Nylanderia fulva TaxID=613905 RepID=UPI0010FAE3F8|nr:uncharacterized protein LOC114938560 [Nylanderia fulva]
MGNLPRDRVTPTRSFLSTGLDYAGPISIRTSKKRGHRSQKGYIAVFICFWSKAIHLEVVSDYSSEAFIAALRRFVSRRGLCTDIYSDCGTTFIGADRTLRELFKASTSEGHHIARVASTQGIRWHFNPPAAPHFGGLWEAAVKFTKFHLRRVIGETTLTFEELSTLLTQIEACLNSRPLQALSDDPDDTSALTPGHFIIGAPLLAVPEPSLTGRVRTLRPTTGRDPLEIIPDETPATTPNIKDKPQKNEGTLTSVPASQMTTHLMESQGPSQEPQRNVEGAMEPS